MRNIWPYRRLGDKNQAIGEFRADFLVSLTGDEWDDRLVEMPVVEAIEQITEDFR